MTLFSSSGGEKEIIRRIPKELVPTGVPYSTVKQLIIWERKSMNTENIVKVIMNN